MQNNLIDWSQREAITKIYVAEAIAGAGAGAGAGAIVIRSRHLHKW